MLKLPHWLKPERKRKPMIMTQWGPVTESARLQAALNIKADPSVRERVLELLTQQSGGDPGKGLVKMKENYPEAFE